MKRAIIVPAILAGEALNGLKGWLAITTSRDDEALTALLRAALEMCEAFTGQMPLETQCEEMLPAARDWQSLATVPVQAITGLDGIGASGLRFTLPLEDYAVDLDAGGSGRVRVLRAGKLTQLMLDAAIPVRFQIGEPWWWTSSDRRICLYDQAAIAFFTVQLGFAPPEIVDLGQPLSADQIALLEQAGARLAWSTYSITSAVQAAAGGAAEVHILIFTPTILDPALPDIRRANLPAGWAWPTFDRLQLEDYDWLTSGAEALRRQAYGIVAAHLAYPLAVQDYLSGFVFDPQNAEAYWQKIDSGIDDAARRGVPRCYVWALPQITRDGYTRLPATEDDTMQAFDDLLYPLALGRDSGVSPEFSTSVTLTASGHERRASHWTDARLRFDVGPGIRSENELGVLIAFFRARRGAARGFRLSDPFDFSSNNMTGTPTPQDQLIGIGNGFAATFQLSKQYGTGDEPQQRLITRPRESSIRISIDGDEVSGWALVPSGKIVFEIAPPAGAQISAGFLFDVPVRFAEDRLDITGAAFAAGEAPSLPLIEVKEAE